MKLILLIVTTFIPFTAMAAPLYQELEDLYSDQTLIQKLEEAKSFQDVADPQKRTEVILAQLQTIANSTKKDLAEIDDSFDQGMVNQQLWAIEDLMEELKKGYQNIDFATIPNSKFEYDLEECSISSAEQPNYIVFDCESEYQDLVVRLFKRYMIIYRLVVSLKVDLRRDSIKRIK